MHETGFCFIMGYRLITVDHSKGVFSVDEADRFRREADFDDRDSDPEYFDEMEETYRDGSLKNECWNSSEPLDSSEKRERISEKKKHHMYKSTPLYINDNLRRTYDTADLIHEYAVKENISEKDERCVSLLTEETIGMMAAMVGPFEAEVWLEGDHDACNICLEARIVPVFSGFEVPRGFMAKIGQILHCSFLFDSREEVPETLRAAIPDFITDGMGRRSDGSLIMGKWSLTSCRRELKEKAAFIAEAREALNEMEMSVVANLADEVIVGISEEGKIRMVITRVFDRKV